MIVILTHICESLNLFTFMLWGREHGVGHYLDLGSAVFGLMLFPTGYFIHALLKKPV